MKEIKTKGKFRKSKAYGLVGCLALFSIMITNPVINVKAEEFNRTDSGQVDNSNTGVNKLIPSEEIKSVPNGERNFYSTVAFTTEAGLGSGTLISPDTIVTVAHNFVHLNEKTNPISVDNNVNKNGDIHIATLPNGKQVKFSNDDVHFWNREGFVNGYKNDLAVIKLKKTFDSQPAELIDFAKKLSNNDKIHVFGFPKGKLQPILNGTVENVENYGANIYGVSYQGSAPGMSGGGLYDSEGKLIGVNQNGVEGLRSGGITFSKEQLDWINSIVRGENAKPVYLEENRQSDEKKSNNFELKNSEEINTLHDWIKDKIAKLDFSKNTKDEFYGLVSEDGKTYGDVRKIVSDWKSAKLSQGNYSIKKLKIIDISDNDRKSHFTVREEPTSTEDGINGDLGLESTPSDLKVERIIDSETNKNLDLMLYSNKSIDETDTPGYYDVKRFFTISENNYNITKEHNIDSGSRYMGFWSIPYGDREITFTYSRDQEFIIGTKSKIEFTNDKVKVRERRVELKNLDVDAHTTTQNYDVIENNYELDKEPRKIVKETPDMKIDEDPGTLASIPDGRRANADVKKLQDIKTGYVFKVKSYEADGTTSYRYFRTWTLPVNTSYGTTIPYSDDENYTNLLKSKISYTPDNELDYGKIKVGASSATEPVNNVSLITWSSDEPKSPNDTNFVQTNKPILDGTENKATTRIEYPETEKINSGIFDLNYIIGTKPKMTKELVENRPVKYLGNENLDVNEKVVKEGKDKFKVTTTNYTLVKTEGEKQDVTPIFDNHIDEIKEINETDKNVPNLENKGVTKEDVITYENAEEKVVEKKINKPKTKKTIIPKSIKYIKDDTRDKGLPNEAIEGKDGSKTITITETINEHTGEITENRSEPIIVNSTDTIVKVAAKTKVETIERDNKVIERTTIYNVDPDNGNITETISEKVVSEKNLELPPVVENLEYTGPLSTNTPVDENGNLILPPVVDELPEFNGGVNSAEPPVNEFSEYKGSLSTNTPVNDKGELELPPVLNIPEYKGPISTNTPVDENGNLILPPVVDLPEYNGDVNSIESPSLEKSEYKEDSNKPKEETIKEEIKAENKKEKELPNTNSTSILATFVSSIIGTLGLGYKTKRRK